MSELSDRFIPKHEYKITVFHNGMIDMSSDYLNYSLFNAKMHGMQSQHEGGDHRYEEQIKLCAQICENITDLEKLSPSVSSTGQRI